MLLVQIISCQNKTFDIELSFIRNIQYSDNMYCGLRSTGTSRIEQAKYNMDNTNIMMTNDLHVPVTSAALLFNKKYIQVLCMNIA